MTLDESIELWQKEHEHEIVYACNMDAEVYEIVDRVNFWHIGTPTEEGWYLLKVKSDDEVIYDTNRLIQCLWGLDWKYVHEEILAWQKIEPYKED